MGQGGALLFSTVATWFGPVAISLPVYVSTMLFWNMVAMSMLRMKVFTKNESIGTFVLIVSSFMLLDAGPKGGAEADAAAYERMGSTPIPLLWVLFLFLLWCCSTVGMVADLRGEGLGPGSLMATYVTAQGIGTSGVTSLGKVLVLLQGPVAVTVVMSMYTLCGLTNTYSSIVAAKKINQGEFIPFASCASLMLNAATGLAVWEDWRSLSLWVTYSGIHTLILLGVYLLSAADLQELHASARQSQVATLVGPHARQWRSYSVLLDSGEELDRKVGWEEVRSSMTPRTRSMYA